MEFLLFLKGNFTIEAHDQLPTPPGLGIKLSILAARLIRQRETLSCFLLNFSSKEHILLSSFPDSEFSWEEKVTGMINLAAD